MSKENFGMMDKAYFTGKNEIISWINKTLNVIFLRKKIIFINIDLIRENRTPRKWVYLLLNSRYYVPWQSINEQGQKRHKNRI